LNVEWLPFVFRMLTSLFRNMPKKHHLQTQEIWLFII
jgi:hypothetical protein